MKDTKFYSVNKTHTLMVSNDTDDFYIGFTAKTNTSSKSKDIVVVFTAEQMFEMIDYFETRMIEKRTLNNPIRKVD